MARKLTIGSLVLAAALAIAASALAGGGRPETYTSVIHGTMSLPAHENPCTHDLGLVTATYNGVNHVTAFPDGHYNWVNSIEGTFVAQFSDPALPDDSGHFADVEVANTTSNTLTVTVLNNIPARWLSFYFRFHLTLVGTEVVVDEVDVICR